MLITGILLGPYVLNVLDPSILSISSELRQIALIIILLKAGLSLNLADLKKVGRPAIMMACIPATFEILAREAKGDWNRGFQNGDFCKIYERKFRRGI